MGPEASSSVSSAAASSAPGAVEKAKKQGVPLGVHLNSTVSDTRFADYLPVLRECVGVVLVAELVEEPRGPLDVGEEERDRARGEIHVQRGLSRVPERLTTVQIRYVTPASRNARDSFSISRAITRRWISFVPS